MQATERIQLRATPHTKAIIEQASQALGVSVSSFILDCAYQRAIATVKEQTDIVLNAQEWQNAIELLEQPAKPAPAMQALFNRGYRCVDN